MLTHGIALVSEIIMYILGTMKEPGTCDDNKFRKQLTELFKWYGILSIHENNKGHEAMDKINSLQGFVSKLKLLHNFYNLMQIV